MLQSLIFNLFLIWCFHRKIHHLLFQTGFDRKAEEGEVSVDASVEDYYSASTKISKEKLFSFYGQGYELK